MRRYVSIISLMIISSILLISCDNQNKPNVQYSENENTSQNQDMMNNKNILGEWIEKSIEVLDSDLDDPRIEETDNDEGFIYYLKSQKMSDLKDSMNVSEDNIIKEKDFDNLHITQSYIGLIQFSRTSNFGLNGEAIEETEHYKEWEETPDDLHVAFAYLEKLLHDLDVAVNHDGEGETYGVTYTLNGENVKDIEKFNGADIN